MPESGEPAAAVPRPLSRCTEIFTFVPAAPRIFFSKKALDIFSRLPCFRNAPFGISAIPRKLFEQLRGTASNQIDGARWGLAHNVGGPTAVSAVTILEGSGV